MAKCSRSKGNNLPPAKWFDFTMVDYYFEELQCGFVPIETNTDTKKCVKLFKDWASARNHHSSLTIERVPNDILLTDTTLQLLEVIIHHGEIKPLGGWQAVAFATRTLGRLGHSTSTHCLVPTASLQPTTHTFNDSNYLRIFRAAIFGKPFTTCFQWQIAYLTAQDLQALCALGSRAISTIRH